MRPRYLVVWTLASAIAFLELTTDCRKPVDPSQIEAGIVEVDTTCRFLQGITDNGNVLSVCATLEEIAFVLSILGPLLAEHPPEKDECVRIPTTNRCATPEQMGYALERLVMRRRAAIMLDGGTP